MQHDCFLLAFYHAFEFLTITNMLMLRIYLRRITMKDTAPTMEEIVEVNRLREQSTFQELQAMEFYRDSRKAAINAPSAWSCLPT